MESKAQISLQVGQRLTVDIEKIAHGGHFIARHESESGKKAVIFVRHAIPGEKVEIEITSTSTNFIRADVIKVISASPDRVQAPCKFSHRNGCGGCDFQHISIERQRSLKSEVIREQFERIAKMDLSVEVEGVGDALHWRTRITATTDHQGSLGFYSSRSHHVIPVDECIIALPEIGIASMSSQKLTPDVRIEIAYSSEGERMVAEAPKSGDGKFRQNTGPAVLHERVGGDLLQVSQRSFWQGHKRAPQVLSDVVRDFAQIQEGENILDLYGGVGLFTSACLNEVGASGSIHLVEGSKDATSDAKSNFADKQNVHITTGDVAKVISRINRADVIILDPPREGAGKDVVQEIARITPRSVIYVACDPAALARDTAYLSEKGYNLKKIRAFDLFPMTHHIECVALFTPNEVS
ncbi:MAG: class I SAM-dependent RNA methyltransferase [Actinobacteria bacterium]|nr:class I SAM-dependent RNA methyltransferase [Actinomycetota bacterium]NDH80844.1 class I SAM-dependent RNA methyltransferase [Actinomycetota bacterium]NDH99027.1 class I SAM-dependent RNA methyltransferase [Actinomycetota bacterium]